MFAALFSHFTGACADLLWPPRCVGCEAHGAARRLPFCGDCRLTLVPLDAHGTCPRCAAPLEARSCVDCRRLPARLSRIFAPYEYGGALADALLRLKWQGRQDLAATLGALLAPSLRAGWEAAGGFDALVPVPLHPRRLRQRGYNQAMLLARAALGPARLEGRLPLFPTALCRVRLDPPARDLGKSERFLRTAGAFTVPRQQAPRLAGKRVLILDDVVTTGATVLGCATALFAAGAAHVEALALLRASPSREQGSR